MEHLNVSTLHFGLILRNYSYYWKPKKDWDAYYVMVLRVRTYEYMVHLLISSSNVNNFYDIKKSLKILSLIHVSCHILTSFSEDNHVAGCDTVQPVTNLPAFRKNVLSPFLG